MIFRKAVDVQKWGLERAVVDMLGPADRAWVEFRYKLASDCIPMDASVLDAACGSGFGSEILALPGRNVTGIDVSREAVAYARKRHGRDCIRFQRMNAERIKFPENSFDAVVGIETLEHLRHAERYLTSLHRVARPSAKIVISSPRKVSEKPLTPFHVKEYEYQELKELLMKYFIVEKIIGLRRSDPPESFVASSLNRDEADIYLAICRNRKYVHAGYAEKYYTDVDCGIKSNPVARFHVEALEGAIVGKRVLNIGCGTGTYESMFSKKDFELHGTDVFSSPLLDAMRAANGFDSVTIVKPSRTFRQPFRASSFDTVYTSHVLEHVEEPELLILESLRLARRVAFHLIPVNLDNPGHIHFFRWGDIDNEYRTQEADIELSILCEKIVREYQKHYPGLRYEIQVVCPRDGSIETGDGKFPVRRPDRPDGLMPCFLVSFHKNCEDCI